MVKTRPNLPGEKKQVKHWCKETLKKKFDLQGPYYQNRKTVLLNLPIVVEILLKGGLCCSVTWAGITQRNYNYTRLSQDGFRLPAHPPPFSWSKSAQWD